MLVTLLNGSVSLIERDKQSADGPYVEVERVPAGLAAADWPGNQYIGSTKWWWVGQTNGTVRGFEYRRNDAVANMVTDTCSKRPRRHLHHAQSA